MPLIPSKNPWEKRVVHLDADLACVHCRYNLRGLPLSGRCPECGGLVWDALLSKDIPALYRSVQMASLALFAIAGIPPLLCATIAMQSTAKNSPGPILITMSLALICILAGAVSWHTMPLYTFRPGSRDRNAVWFATLAAVLLLVAGTALTLTANAVQQVWIPRAWDGALLALCGYFALVLRTPVRMLYLLQMYGMSRAILVIQVAAILCAVLSLASIAQEFLPAAGALRDNEFTLCAIVGFLSSIILATAAFHLRRYAAPAIGGGHRDQ